MWWFEVPNAPCGVESYAENSEEKEMLRQFLMHRVELKAELDTGWEPADWTFLMHRVELKDIKAVITHSSNQKSVPNAPCGVERYDPKTGEIIEEYGS